MLNFFHVNNAEFYRCKIADCRLLISFTVDDGAVLQPVDFSTAQGISLGDALVDKYHSAA